MIESRGVTYLYPGSEAPALRGVDLRIAAGESVALLGANGSGKTTLLHILVGVLRPDEGAVLMDGAPVTRRNVLEVRRRVGLLFQEPDDQVFAPTVAEDVAFGPVNIGLAEDEVQERVDWALSLVGLGGYERRAPHTLSGGERKRVALAGVAAMRPEVLLLDEPFAGLDAHGRRDAVALVRSVHRELGAALLIATHDTQLVAEVSERAVVLAGGMVALSGPVERVLGSPRLEALGVEAPPLGRLTARLRARGVGVAHALTLDDAEEALLHLLRR